MDRDAKGLPDRVTGVAHAAAWRAVMGPFSTGDGRAKAPVMAEATAKEKRPFMLTSECSCFVGLVLEALGVVGASYIGVGSYAASMAPTQH